MEKTLPDTKRFLGNYVSGRQAYFEYREQNSKYRKINMGDPKGGVLSSILFHLYPSSLPQPPQAIHMVSFADDITVFTSGEKRLME